MFAQSCRQLGSEGRPRAQGVRMLRIVRKYDIHDKSEAISAIESSVVTRQRQLTLDVLVTDYKDLGGNYSDEVLLNKMEHLASSKLKELLNKNDNRKGAELALGSPARGRFEFEFKSGRQNGFGV